MNNCDKFYVKCVHKMDEFIYSSKTESSWIILKCMVNWHLFAHTEIVYGKNSKPCAVVVQNKNYYLCLKVFSFNFEIYSKKVWTLMFMFIFRCSYNFWQFAEFAHFAFQIFMQKFSSILYLYAKSKCRTIKTKQSR